MNQTLLPTSQSSQSDSTNYEILTDFRKSIKQFHPEANTYMIFENIKKWLNLQDYQKAECLKKIKTAILGQRAKIRECEQKNNLDDLLINDLVSQLWKSPQLEIEKQEIFKIIKDAIDNQGFTDKTDNLYALFYVILDLTKPSIKLFKYLVKLIEKTENEILLSSQEGKQYLGNLIRLKMIENWREGALSDYFAQIESKLVKNDNSFWLLITYGYILRHNLKEKNNNSKDKDGNNLSIPSNCETEKKSNKLLIPFNCETEKNNLLELRLVIKDENKQLRIANQIYQEVFNEDWLKETLMNLVSEDETKKNLLHLISCFSLFHS